MNHFSKVFRSKAQQYTFYDAFFNIEVFEAELCNNCMNCLSNKKKAAKGSGKM
jgi:hypothetical protein